MPIELYPSVAKIKRNGVYENLPGFVPETGAVATQQMIATSESSATAQYVHNKGEYFRLNDTLYQAIVKINVGDAIVVGTNCEVAVIGNDLTHVANSIAAYELGIATSSHNTGDYFMVNETMYVATADIQVGDNISTSTNCRVAVVGDELSGLKTAISVLEPTATSADIGKALIAKTVTNDVVTEYEFGEAGGSDLSDVGVISFDNAETYQGVINSTGKWASINANNTFKVLPIKSGDIVTITAGTKNLFVAFLAAFSTPVNQAAVDLSTATGFDTRLQITIGQTQTYTTPSDAHYLWVQTMSGGNDVTPVSILINGYETTKNLGENIVDIQTELENGLSTFKNTFYNGINDILIVPDKLKYYANIDSSGKYNHVGESNYYFVLIKINGGERYKITAPSDHTTQFAVLASFTEPVANASVPFSAASGFTSVNTIAINAVSEGTLPSDGRYVMLILQSGGSVFSPYSCNIADIDYTKSVYDNVRDVIDRNVNWASMGDSIAYGTRSYMNGDTPAERNDPELSWANTVATKNFYNWTNIATPGCGYLYKNGQRSAGYEVARATDYTAYNLVTLAYGVNDWKGNQPLGTINDDATAATPTTMMQAMKITIEAIMTSNPLCKIIVILPLNCRGYLDQQTQEFPYGDFSTNYALGYTLNGKTLEDFVQGIIDVCEYYGLQYIDMAHASVVNRCNLPDLLLDGVHPSQEAHALLGAEMARKITFA